MTAALFELGKVLIGLYVGKAGISSTYAAAGSIAIILIWVYYAAQIFLLGAEFTKVYADEHGSRKAAKALEATEETKESGVPQETPDPAAPLEPFGFGPQSRRPGPVMVDPRESPAIRAAEVPLKVATTKLVFELVALGVLTLAGALLSRRRKTVMKSLIWTNRLTRHPRKRLSSRA